MVTVPPLAGWCVGRTDALYLQGVRARRGGRWLYGPNRSKDVSKFDDPMRTTEPPFAANDETASTSTVVNPLAVVVTSWQAARSTQEGTYEVVGRWWQVGPERKPVCRRGVEGNI
jgi:hypothetical protein